LLRATEQTCYEWKIISYEYLHPPMDGDVDDDDTTADCDRDVLHNTGVQHSRWQTVCM